MTNTTVTDFGRRDLDFRTPKVIEILPEHFREDYPKLIEILELYQQYMHHPSSTSSSAGKIDNSIRDIISSRDINSLSLEFLNYLFYETGINLDVSLFDDPYLIIKFLPDFFRYKGSLFSVKAFFRALYGEEVDVSYPKDQLFIVGESKIGPESLKYIQNGQLWQVLSILIKSSKPASEWIDLYKKLVHPAGFYIGGEVLLEGLADVDFDYMPEVILDSSANVLIVGGDEGGTAQIDTIYIDDPMTAIIISPDSDTEYRTNLSKVISAYSGDSFTNVNEQYSTIADMTTINTVGFSDSQDDEGITFANTIEKWSQSTFDSNSSNIWSE